MKKLIISFLLIIAMATQVYAEQIEINVNNNKPPKVWGEGEAVQGILVDILKLTEQELGTSFKFKAAPWARTYQNSVRGKGGIVGISVTDERLKIFDFSAPLYYDDVVLVVKKGKEFTFNEYPDLKGKKVGLCRGCSFGPAEEAKKYFISEEDNGAISRLKKLLAGRLDAAIVNPGAYALKRICNEDPALNFEDFSILSKPLTSDPNYLAFSKDLNQKPFLEKFNKILKQKLDSGEVQKIIDKY